MSHPPGEPVTTEPDRQLGYHQLHRGGKHDWWRPVLGVTLLLVAMVIVVPLLLLPIVVVAALVQGGPLVDGFTAALDLTDPQPVTLLYLNLSLAAAIPVAAFLVWLLHGLRPRWLTSVAPRMRWKYFSACLGLSVLALAVTVVVGALVPADPAGLDTGRLNDFTRTTFWFALVVLLTTPLQAAGEEYAFRGYLTQAVGGLFNRRWVAVVVPALVFAFSHGVQDVPIFFDRFAFGLVAGWLVVATGGLEAALAMHVLNNFLAFGVALAFGDIGASLTVSEGSWWNIPVTLTQSLVYLALALLLARRMGLRTTVDRAVLVASRSPVYRHPSVPQGT